MSYVKNDWTPSSSGTPVMATPTKFNHFEQGIYDNSLQADKVPQLRTDTDSLILAEKVENGQRASLSVLGYSCPKLSDTVYDYVQDNVLHKKVGRVDLGELDWQFGGSGIYYTVVPNYSYPTSKSTEKAPLLCSKYTTTSQADSDNKNISGYNGGTNLILVRDYDLTTVASFKSAIKGTYLYYELSTEQTYSVLDNNALDSVGVCTNLLKPTLVSGVYSGVTVVANSDGTYTLNTSQATSADVYISVGTITVPSGVGKVKFLGMPSGGQSVMYLVNPYTVGNGSIIEGTITDNRVFIVVGSGKTLSNEVIKPFVTTNLSAQYIDFVPFTGTSGRLNSDVAEITKNLISVVESGTYTFVNVTPNGQGSTTITLAKSYSNAMCLLENSQNQFGFETSISGNQLTISAFNHSSATRNGVVRYFILANPFQ